MRATAVAHAVDAVLVAVEVFHQQHGPHGAEFTQAAAKVVQTGVVLHALY
jgi:hypothetical protein